MALKHSTTELFVPSMKEVADVLSNGLKGSFETIQCKIVACPNLSGEPFNLAAPGICGSTCLADVGGNDNLLPLAKVEKLYDMNNVLQLASLPSGFLIGAGFGPHHIIGNCELVANLKCATDKVQTNGSYYGKWVPQTDGYESIPSKSSEFALLGQFLCSKGEPGEVIEIVASKRIKNGSFVTFIREVLTERYKQETAPVGLGGVFLMESGRAKIHVMPPFSKEPLDCDSKVNAWLKFYEMPAPLVAVGDVVSHDPWNQALRLEHFHCFTHDRSMSGHFHYDLTPEEVTYKAYLVPGERLLRVDQPSKA